MHIVRGRGVLAEMKKGRQLNLFLDLSERECEPFSIVEHEHAVRVAARRRCIESQVGLVEPTRPLLIADGESEVVHGA